MPDIFTKKKRSEIMSHISGRETKQEILVRKFLFSKGFRFRKNDCRFPGKPDIVLPKYKRIIFIHGCFWHGHKSCERSKLPVTRKKFWSKKIESNIKRDNKNISALKKMGWNVTIIWQCQLKNISCRSKTLSKLEKQLTKCCS